MKMEMKRQWWALSPVMLTVVVLTGPFWHASPASAERRVMYSAVRATRSHVVSSCVMGALGIMAMSHMYRQYYDPSYTESLRVAVATDAYRELYDRAYTDALRVATATNEYREAYD